MNSRPTILVTGGTGFVGAHLLFHLTSQGFLVKALKRQGSSTLLAQRIFTHYTEANSQQWGLIEWVTGDIMDITSLQHALKGVDQLYHAAAIVSFQGKDQSQINRVNRIGTANIVNVALEIKIKKLLFVSSIGALGRADHNTLVTEENHWNNKKTSSYSKSKYEAEQEVWRGMAEGLNAVIINPSIILGPGNWSQGSSQLFSTMYHGLKFYTSGSNGFVDVNDVSKAMIWLMHSPIVGERFIISSENITYKQLFYWMAEALMVTRPPWSAGRILSAMSWRILAFKGFITGNKSSITKETAETANQPYQYDNSKFLRASGFEFTKVKLSIEATAKIFLKEHSN